MAEREGARSFLRTPPRLARLAVQLAVSGGVLAFLLIRLDPAQVWDEITAAKTGYVVAALAILFASTWAMAWRWQILLASKGIDEPLGWLTKLYFVGYAASQVLPTSVGGDAVRILDHARRRPDAGAVLMERLLGVAGTVLLLLLGLLLAIGDERVRVIGPVGAALIAAAAVLLLLLLFSRRVEDWLRRRVFPLGRRIGIERPLASVYRALHGYRDCRGALLAALAITFATQLARTVSIWLCCAAVGIHESAGVFVVFAALLSLVMVVPFTLNGLGVREAFFVGYFGRFDVSNDTALAAGLLFYAIILAESIPGAVILLWHSLAGAVAHPRTE
jgi:glycosyltransferase 2 family protein